MKHAFMSTLAIGIAAGFSAQAQGLANPSAVLVGTFGDDRYVQCNGSNDCNGVFERGGYELTVRDSAAFSVFFSRDPAVNVALSFHPGTFDVNGPDSLAFTYSYQFFPDDPATGFPGTIPPEGEYTLYVIYQANVALPEDLSFFVQFTGVTLGWGPSVAEQLDELAAVFSQGGRYSLQIANANIHDVAQRSIAKRKASKVQTNETASLMGDVNAWVRLSAISADSNTRDFDTQMLQFGADVAIGTSIVAGLAVGVGDLNAETTGFSYEGSQTLVQPYIGWTHGTWRGSASLVYGDIDYGTITSGSGAATAEGEMYALTANVSRDFALSETVTLTPFFGIEAGETKLTATTGSLATAGLNDKVDFTETRFGAVMSAALGGGVLTMGASANYFDTDAPTVLTSGQYDDTGWSGSTQFGYSIGLGGNTVLDTNIQVGGIGTGTISYSGTLQVSMTF